MPRASAAAIENNFVRGLVTEVSALNAPENSCSEAENVYFNLIGTVQRRPGMDYEFGYTTKTINRTASAINTYVWRNVANDGTVNLAVLQVGSTLYFYDTSDLILSQGALATTIDLTDFSASGAPTPETKECQFASGNGLLFVTHPYLEPFFVSYVASTQTATGTQIAIQVRDFEGLPASVDDLDVDERSTSITDAHRYNLCNQGWGAYIAAYTSTTSITIGTGSKTFTIATGLTTLSANDFLYIVDADNAANYMSGVVTSYTSGTGALVMDIKSISGSGTKTNWAIGHQFPTIQIFKNQMGVYPSNSDVWWVMKNASEAFAPSTTDGQISRTNQRAAQGHFILNPFDQQRDALTGLTITDVTTSGQRPAAVAFFAGRAWYAGTSSTGFGGQIFFSQIALTDTTKYGHCYQSQDPTSETLSELLPDDGGVINIPEAGIIMKLFAVGPALIVFATNGVWAISGSAGLGFSANDYSVSKISASYPLSATSFVSVQGYPMWWANDGIYRLRNDPSQGGAVVEAVSKGVIDSYYLAIPLSSRQYARGYYSPTEFTVNWVFRSDEGGGTLEELYSFDTVLVHNVQTTSFSAWPISASTPKINGILNIESAGGTIDTLSVIDDAAATVQNDAGANVVAYQTSSGATAPVFKYLVSADDGASSYDFTFAETWDTSYVDWYSYDTAGVDFTSYFVCGPKVHGDAQRKFQANYLYAYISNDEVNKVKVRGIWNYATSGAKITSYQTLTTSGLTFDVSKKRLKIPGFGVALQYQFTSISGYPFTVHGWSAFETATGQP